MIRFYKTLTAAFVFSLTICPTAQASFIDDWLSANNICGQRFRGSSYLFALHSDGLLGKAPIDWSDSDLQLLQPAFKRCENVARERGINIIISETGGLMDPIDEISKTVNKAKVEASRQVEQEAARSRIQASEDKQKAESAHKHQLEAERSRKLAEQDKENADREVQAASASAQALIASAHARRDAAIARQKVAALEAEAKEAQAEADRAEEVAKQPSPKQSEPDGLKDNPLKQSDNIPTSATTFAFTVDSLKRSFNIALKRDGDSGLGECSKLEEMTACSFDDKAFQASVAEFKKQDLLNGSFKLKLFLGMNTLGNHVNKVVLQGDRADPPNMFQFIGKTGDLLRVFEPGISDAEVQTLLRSKLGLMRGDNDDTIGQEQSNIRKTFVVSCNQSSSSESTIMRCEFDPRS